MNIHHLHRKALAFLLCGPFVLAAAAGADAQPAEQTDPTPVARSFDELSHRLQSGTTIFVTDSAGNEVSGRLGKLSDTTLSLLVHGKPQTFSVDEVGLVKRREHDSLWNGFLIGAAAGSVPAVYWLFADPNECGNSICMGDLLLGVAGGGLIGLGIDRAIKAKVIVYRKGVGLTVSF
jgi:hypothetical protein